MLVCLASLAVAANAAGLTSHVVGTANVDVRMLSACIAVC